MHKNSLTSIGLTRTFSLNHCFAHFACLNQRSLGTSIIIISLSKAGWCSTYFRATLPLWSIPRESLGSYPGNSGAWEGVKIRSKEGKGGWTFDIPFLITLRASMPPLIAWVPGSSFVHISWGVAERAEHIATKITKVINDPKQPEREGTAFLWLFPLAVDKLPLSWLGRGALAVIWLGWLSARPSLPLQQGNWPCWLI